MELDDRELKRLKELVPYKILSPTPDEICEEIERLNNIIEEAREYIEKNYDDYEEFIYGKEFKENILEILDKGCDSNE